MTGWLETLGIAGVLLAAFTGVASSRMLTAGSRNLWLAVGFFLWVVGVEFGRQSPPKWVTTVGGVALVIAGSGRLWRWSSERRRKLEGALLMFEDAGDWANEARGLFQRFCRVDDIDALNGAVERFRRAVEVTSGDRSHLANITNLVIVLRVRYERLRSVEDLDEAIDIGRNAAHIVPGKEPGRGRLCAQLSTALRLRYDHIGAAGDLEEAYTAGLAAVRLIPFKHLHFPACAREFAVVLYSRYERTNDRSHLDLAVTYARRALESTRRRGYERVIDLTTLCHLLVQRGRAANALPDLDEAIDAGRRALKHAPVGHVLFETCQNNLALALRTRYELRHGTGPGHDPAAIAHSPAHRRYELRSPTSDLDEAIRLAQRATDVIAADVPERAVHELNLALALHGRYRHDGDQRKLGWALAAASRATCSSADVATRVRAGLAWSDMAASAGRYAEAVTAFETVIGLLPKLASRELRRADQEDRLGRWTGIAVTAAACALAEGRWDKAVTLLEQGRGVLLSRALDVRTDLAPLRSRHPELAEEFDTLRAALDATYDLRTGLGAALGDEGVAGRNVATDANIPGADRTRRLRRALDGRWDALLERIRAQEGFAGFARPPAPEQILAQGRDAPVVYLNVSELRSDAIILAPDGVRTVELNVRPRDAAEQTAKLYAELRPGRMTDRERQKPVYEVLAWLWDALVEPVMNALDMRSPACDAPSPACEAPLPRVWWVPTGPLAALPIHAAGHHGLDGPGAGDGSRSLLDRAISSYAPTVRALAVARERESGIVGARPRPLVVAMSQTPGAGPLTGAAAEAEVVRELFPDALVLSDDEASRERVLAELPNVTWAHFACHAVADGDVPSRGRLLLHDHRHDPLTVADICRLDLGRAEMAYLSSCDSARTGPRHADEAIHLAASFQLAGFAQVIASLWPVMDRFAVPFAKEIYRQLGRSATSAAAPDVALAVHRATRLARTRYPNLPGLWAGYVHVGS